MSKYSKMSWDDGDDDEEDELASVVTLKVSKLDWSVVKGYSEMTTV